MAVVGAVTRLSLLDGMCGVDFSVDWGRRELEMGQSGSSALPDQFPGRAALLRRSELQSCAPTLSGTTEIFCIGIRGPPKILEWGKAAALPYHIDRDAFWQLLAPLRD